MASRRWLRGQSDVTVSLSAPRPLTTLGASRSTGPFDEVRRVYGDFPTALPLPPTHPSRPRAIAKSAFLGLTCSDGKQQAESDHPSHRSGGPPAWRAVDGSEVRAM